MRFNIYGGPCSGKSVVAAYVFNFLKKEGYSIELVQEYCKSWAYLKREIGEFDQVYFFGKQLHYEERLLKNGALNTVSDSPPLQATVYSELYYSKEIAQSLRDIEKYYTKGYPATTIFLKRNEDFAYDENGRYQNLEEAKRIDKAIKRVLPKGAYFVDPEDKDTLDKILLKNVE